MTMIIFLTFRHVNEIHSEGKLHSKFMSSDLIDFSVESNGEGPWSKFERKDGQTDSEKMACASVCDVSGAISQ